VNTYDVDDPEVDLDTWRLTVSGDVQRPGEYTLAQIQSLPKLTQNTRHICVEGWDAIGRFGGTRISDFLQYIGANQDAKFLYVECADDYYESLDMASALHPQSLLCYEMYDQPLTREHGAPLRLSVPTKIGYKQAKYLTSLRVTDVVPKKGYWEDQGYPLTTGSSQAHFYGSVKFHTDSSRRCKSGRRPGANGLRASLGCAVLSLAEYRFAFCDGRERLANFPGLPELWAKGPSAQLTVCSEVSGPRRLARRRAAMAHDVRMDLRGNRRFLYIAYQVFSRNYRQPLFVGKDLAGVWPMIRHYFFFGRKPPQTEAYNPLQKMAYTSAILFGLLSVLTGIVLFNPVQFSLLATLMGGFHWARVWHFCVLCALLLFVLGHLIMVISSWMEQFHIHADGLEAQPGIFALKIVHSCRNCYQIGTGPKLQPCACLDLTPATNTKPL